MNFSTDGLVIREQKIKEGNKVVTVLTRDRGVIRAFANGTGSIKSSKNTATGLITYSCFDIFLNSKGIYTIDDAHAKDVFMPLRQDVEKMSAAQYFCELIEHLAPRDVNAEEQLRLILNSLYMIANDKRPTELVKCIFELRLMTISGYVPDLVCCRDCRCYEDDNMRFLPESGQIICGSCFAKYTNNTEHIERSFFIGKTLNNAMRHCVYSEFNKLFSFRLSDKSTFSLGNITEYYCTMRIGKEMKTLEFYKMIRNTTDDKG